MQPDHRSHEPQRKTRPAARTRASKLDPAHANTAFALAELLAASDRRDEAFAHYQRAAELFRRKIGPLPRLEHCDDLVKLATAQLWIGDPQSGLKTLDAAIALRPDHALALARRGMTLAKLRRIPEAIASLKRASAVDRGYAEVRRALGEILLSAGDDDAAQRQLRAATRIDPDDELACYFLAAASGESPDAPPPTYVRRLFDDYAEAFDRHLVDVLRYRAPEIACAAVLELVGPSAAQWSVIDLGCGTGLCGPLIRHAARRLVGVDLSAAMLEKARAKGVYDELVQGDAVEVLARHADAFDVALCTDVMIYVGSLAPMFSAAGGALRPGALLAFTTEVHPGDGFVVDRTRRYRHSRGYVEQELARHGFALARVEPIVARYQSGEPDVQNLFVARR